MLHRSLAFTSDKSKDLQQQKIGRRRSTSSHNVITDDFKEASRSILGEIYFFTLDQTSQVLENFKSSGVGHDAGSLQLPTDNPIKHFNNAGCSPQPLPVLQKVIQHNLLESVLGGYLAAEQCQNERDLVYWVISKLINAQDPLEIALVESATVAWTRVFYAMCDCLNCGDNGTGDSDVILCCEAEYAANIVAIEKICKERDATLIMIPADKGMVDMDEFTKILNGEWSYYEFYEDTMEKGKKILNPDRIRMVCITHIPTNSGIINPVYEIGDAIEEFNKKRKKGKKHPLYYLVDACQSVGQIDVDVAEMKCHALSATGRKYLRAPRGTGFLYVKKDIADKLVPQQVDHAAAPIKRVPIDEVEDIEYEFHEGALRFEFWEKNIANQLGLGLAVNYAIKKDMGWIEEQCITLAMELKGQLRKLNVATGGKIYVHHENLDHDSTQCGIVTFAVRGIDSASIKEDLLAFNFVVSVVPPTSTPFDSSNYGLNEIELLRVSLSYFNTEEEILDFSSALKTIISDEN